MLFEQPYSKIDFVVDRLGVERKASSRYLKKLEEIGILKSQKIGRETIYINLKLIDILKTTKHNTAYSKLLNCGKQDNFSTFKLINKQWKISVSNPQLAIFKHVQAHSPMANFNYFPR